jgi:hypothetical protein
MSNHAIGNVNRDQASTMLILILLIVIKIVLVSLWMLLVTVYCFMKEFVLKVLLQEKHTMLIATLENCQNILLIHVLM